MQEVLKEGLMKLVAQEVQLIVQYSARSTKRRTYEACSTRSTINCTIIVLLALQAS